jgi:acyl-coenzyme A thioesterase PaaI-like protein
VLSWRMHAANKLSKLIARIEKLPRPLRRRSRSLLIGRVVKFVGTARLDIEELTGERAVVSIKNRRIVQNHLGSVHAAAMALIAETASGFVVGMNVPDDRVPVIKTLKVDYLKRAKGALRAVAELTPAQIDSIHATEKGEVRVKVSVTDEAGVEPIACEMIWAWTPRRR